MELNCIERKADKTENKKLKSEGKMPAVCYAPSEDPKNVAVDVVNFEKTYRENGGVGIIEGAGVLSGKRFIIKDVQYNPISGSPIHADFFIVDEKSETEVLVPLEFIGSAPAEKLGLVIVHSLNEIHLSGPVINMPKHIDIDVSVLVDESSKIHISDIKLPKGIVATQDSGLTIASVNQPEEEEVEETPEEFDAGGVEIDKKGKKEEEDGEDTSN